MQQLPVTASDKIKTGLDERDKNMVDVKESSLNQVNAIISIPIRLTCFLIPIVLTTSKKN